MPKTRRDRLKGSIATAMLDLERALQQIAEVETTFSGIHNDLAEALSIAGVLIIQAEDLLTKFYERAWGTLPDDWVKTRDRK